jgi:hypothetical protein
MRWGPNEYFKFKRPTHLFSKLAQSGRIPAKAKSFTRTIRPTASTRSSAAPFAADEVIGNETLSVIRTSRRFGSNLCRVDNSAKLCDLSGLQKNGKAEHRGPALPNLQKRFTANALLQGGKF